MAYFSPKATWLSLVDSQDPHLPLHDGNTVSFEDYRPCFPGQEEEPDSSRIPVDEEDQELLKLTRDLRHRLFFQFKEWEFGPALLEDHMRLAQMQSDAGEALGHYCHARFVAKTLVEKYREDAFIIPWLEVNRVIAEVHHLLGNHESCAMYAKEGLSTIKGRKFEASMDMHITKLATRFLRLLGRQGI